MKKIKVLLVVFFAAIILVMGIGIITVQAYRVPEQGYLALGMSMFINSNFDEVNPLDSETIAKIENGSLTFQEIDNLKNVLQNSINKGFENWQKGQTHHSGMSMKSTNRDRPDNETVKSMFFSFLCQNPRYLEQFKLYDKLLSREIELKLENITRQVHESSQNMNLIIEQGQVVREWNKTVTINGENCTAINRVYTLEINGTTQTVTKVSIYSPNGTKITDPYIYLIANPLIYWTQIGYWTVVWWGWVPVPIWVSYYVPVPYGYDCLCYVRYPNNVGTPSEATVFAYSFFWDQYQQDQSWKTIVNLLSVVGSVIGAIAAAILTVGVSILVQAAAGAVISGAVGGFFFALGQSVDNVFMATWNTMMSVYEYNNYFDPNYGICVMQRFHYVCSPQYHVWDVMSFMTWHFAYFNGANIQVVPHEPLVIPLDSNSAGVIWLCTASWFANFGEHSWVWIGSV